MRVWITKDERDLYYISRLKPIIETVMGTERKGIYPKPKEILWLDKMCKEGILLVFGGLVEESYVPHKAVVNCRLE